MSQDPFYAAALRFAREHGYRGDELPCGKPVNGVECPLGRAIRGTVGASTWQTNVGCGHLPENVVAFVFNFDQGHYPDLVEGAFPLPAESYEQTCARMAEEWSCL